MDLLPVFWTVTGRKLSFGPTPGFVDGTESSVLLLFPSEVFNFSGCILRLLSTSVGQRDSASSVATLNDVPDIGWTPRDS